MRVDTTVLRGEPDRGYLAKSVAGAVDVTLRADETAHKTIQFSGAITANINVIFPLGAENRGVWHFENTTSGAFTVTVKGEIGTGIVITQGTRQVAAWTGADFVPWTAAL